MSNFARKTTVFVPWCLKLYNSTENYLHTKVLYISSSFGLMGVESHDFSQAEKERTACKAKQIHKMTTIFTQDNFECYLFNLLSFQLLLFSSQLVINNEIQEQTELN